MSNKQAPYKDQKRMRSIRDWWTITYPDNRAQATMIELYFSYQQYAGLDVSHVSFIDPNQFAKCLVAAKIADTGGRYAMIDIWEPKAYEIARAKAY